MSSLYTVEVMFICGVRYYSILDRGVVQKLSLNYADAQRECDDWNTFVFLKSL